MSKSNPTTRPDAPNYEVRNGIIHRYEPMTIAEAFGALSQVKAPLCGFRDADFQPWQQGKLYYVHPGGAEPYRTRSGAKFQQCARITAEDPRKVPEGVPELPEPWLAYVPQSIIFEKGLVARVDMAVAYFEKFEWSLGGDHPFMLENYEGHHYAIDVRTAFAREYFPEYVEALGYSLEEAFRWSIGAKVKPIGSDKTGEVTVVSGDTAIVIFSDRSCASFLHGMLEAAEERIQMTDTQMIDKLAEYEETLPDGRQFWQVFTDRADPKMTLREAIEAWGADE